jgi:hypothetical protein
MTPQAPDPATTQLRNEVQPSRSDQARTINRI